MKRILLFITVLTGLVLIFSRPSEKRLGLQDREPGKTPNDWFFLQRAFPYGEINYEARITAYLESQAALAKTDYSDGEGWVLGGPVNIPGRISALAMHPGNMEVIYAGTASGGIFKTINTGQTWTPIFDNAVSLSIGDIAIAESDPNVLYVGTGEANAGGGSMSYDGFGMYKSTNAGWTWEHIGLENSGSIGRVAVHPQNPQIVFVAAMGRLFSKNEERGIFRTTDGGSTWEKVLFVNDSTGGIDILFHPQHPDTLYAVTWERVRRPDYRNYGGLGSAIYRSYNGGDTWTKLAGGLPVPSAGIGRIGIDISASDPDVLYTIYADNIGYFYGVYKTINGGNTWTHTNDGALGDAYASYGWWFGRLSIDPSDPDIVYIIGFDLYKTIDGGSSWNDISYSVHVDHHDLIVHPLNPDFVVNGNDGGIYLSYNGGSSWTWLDNMPVTQFYTCEVDEQHPERLYGGTQDNGTNRTMTGNTDDWESIYGGDGFHVLVDPQNNNYVYAEYQYGSLGRSTNGGTYFNYAMNGISLSDRMNWNTPVVFDPQDPQILYYGANRVYRTTNRAQLWQVISPDLSNGNAGQGGVVYGTITTIAAAPTNSGFIYVGLDDGNVWRSENTGGSWTDISAGLPQRWVTKVAVDPSDENIVYVTLSGYRNDSYLPHVFRSTDAGQSWLGISGDLPECPVNDIIPDPSLDSTLYIATDFGVYVTRNLGMNWQMLGANLPNVPVIDLDLHQPTRKLIAATYGRSMYTFNLEQLVAVHETKAKEKKTLLIYPNPASDEVRFLFNPRGSGFDYRIIDPKGGLIKSNILLIQNGLCVIPVYELKDGVYVLEVEGAKERWAGTFIKK
jgi:photosystem II stability/assembly factor-like uncharacterized protein